MSSSAAVPPPSTSSETATAEFVVGPNDPREVWLNWIVRSRRDGVAVGTMQASLSTRPEGQSVADVAWVIGVAWQGHGFASEAARSLVAWLRSHGVDEITAHINPDHHASAIVGRRAGLHPSNEQQAARPSGDSPNGGKRPASGTLPILAERAGNREAIS